MGRLPVEKKKKTAWPWVAGVVVLALVIWGTTALLTEDPEPDGPDIGVTAADTLPPSPIPTDTDPPAGTRDTSPPNDTADTLDEDQVGETVRTEGEVVATGNEAFWILVDSRILRVDSPRRARKGDTVSVRGTLMDADTQKTDRIASEVISRHPDFESWTVLRSLKLVEEGATETAAR